MNISVIVITLDEAGCIAQLLKEIPKDLVGEVLVVDGHSTDGTQEVVKKLGYNLVLQKEKGYGRAFPEGARCAKGDT